VPVALVTGIAGQDGSFLAELLLAKGYEVVGMVHGRGAAPAAAGLDARVGLVGGELLEPATVAAAVAEAAPDEIYHFAGPSFVPASWERPQESLAAVAAGTASVLAAARDLPGRPRVYVAGSGLMFGAAPESPQNERTPCAPGSPYAIAKLAAFQLVAAMREHDGLHACTGITYNHESERRPERFVTRKISRAAAAISLGLEDEVALGDLDARRDWSFAGDVVRGAWLMLQQDEPADYVLASGVARTVREFARVAFAHVGLEVEGHVRVDPAFVRPREPTANVGDPTRARERLGWEPQLSFEELVGRMVDADLRRLRGADASSP